MTERKPPDSLEALDARLSEAERRQAGEKRRGLAAAERMSGFGFAWRVGLELVSALIVGVAIGYMLDRWLGTRPWLLILFFILGSAAGLLNVFRLTSGLGGTVGSGKASESRHSTDDTDDE